MFEFAVVPVGVGLGLLFNEGRGFSDFSVDSFVKLLNAGSLGAFQSLLPSAELQ